MQNKNMKKAALSLFSAVLFFGMPMLVFAEEVVMPVTESRSEIVADVNIYDAHIIKQENNKLEVGFVLSNGKGAQSDIRYSVKLVKEMPDEINNSTYQKVYEDKVTLAENSKLEKKISVEVPSYFDGKYELWLFSKNGDGLPLSSSMVEVVTIQGSNDQYINIDEATCNFSIKGLDRTFSLKQGVDIAPSEELNLSCEAESFFDKAITAKVSIETFKRTIYGDRVVVAGEPQSIVFNPKEKKRIEIALPKPSDPQAYDIAMTLVAEENISSTIQAHYVIQGESATISNLQLDKSAYAKGERVTASFIWSLAADNFPGARSGSDKTTNPTTPYYYSLSIKNNNDDCIKPIKHELLTQNSITSKAIADIIKDCAQPKVALAIEDENGKVLVKKDYDFTPSNQADSMAQPVLNGGGREAINTRNIAWVVIGIVTLMALIAMIGYGVKNRSAKLFIWLVLGGSIFMAHDAGAATTLTTYVTSTGSVFKYGCDFSISPATINLGSSVRATTSGCEIIACGNEYRIKSYIDSDGSGTITDPADLIVSGSVADTTGGAAGSQPITWAVTAKDSNHDGIGYTDITPTTVGNKTASFQINFAHEGWGITNEDNDNTPSQNVDNDCTLEINSWRDANGNYMSGIKKVYLNIGEFSEANVASSGYTRCWQRSSSTGTLSYSVINNTCQGTIPTGSVAYDAEENTSLTDNTTNWTYSSSDTRTKCEYKCATGYYRNGEVCSLIVNGVCGLANNSSSASAPTVNLCSTGTASAVTTNVSAGKYNWQCIGSGGSTADCSANIYVAAGTCNQAVAKTNPAYPVSDSNWPTITCPGTGVYIPPTGRTRRWIPARQCPVKFCSTGTEPTPAPIFPAVAGGTVSWTCTGINSPTNATCTAKKDYYKCTPLTPNFPHASMCNFDDKEVINSADVAWKLKDYSGCTDRKCEYACSTGYRLESGACACQVTNCAVNTCIGKTCKDCVGNDLTDVPGAKDCRDLNWKEVAPN